MIIKISKTDEIEKRLSKEGKITILDKPEHIAAMLEFNKKMEEVRKEYRRKDALCWEAAKNVTLC